MGQWLSDRLGQQYVVENKPAPAPICRPRRSPRHARWPHAPGDRDPNEMTASCTTPLVQHSARYRAGCLFRRHALCHGGDVVVSGANGFRTDRSRQGQLGKINMALNGTGNLTHVAGEYFKTMAGVDLFHVPYRGEMEARPIGKRPRPGHVRSHHRLARRHQGRQAACARRYDAAARRLAARDADRQRVRAGLRSHCWIGFRRHQWTPAEIICKLNQIVNAGLADPTSRAASSTLHIPMLMSPADHGKLIACEIDNGAR